MAEEKAPLNILEDPYIQNRLRPWNERLIEQQVRQEFYLAIYGCLGIPLQYRYGYEDPVVAWKELAVIGKTADIPEEEIYHLLRYIQEVHLREVPRPEYIEKSLSTTVGWRIDYRLSLEKTFAAIRQDIAAWKGPSTLAEAVSGEVDTVIAAIEPQLEWLDKVEAKTRADLQEAVERGMPWHVIKDLTPEAGQEVAEIFVKPLFSTTYPEFRALEETAQLLDQLRLRLTLLVLTESDATLLRPLQSLLCDEATMLQTQWYLYLALRWELDHL